MFHDFNSLRQEVEAKQGRFQSRAAQERLVNACLEAGEPTPAVIGRPEAKRTWFLALRLRLVRQSK
jgi:hypothetical protein